MSCIVFPKLIWNITYSMTNSKYGTTKQSKQNQTASSCVYVHLDNTNMLVVYIFNIILWASRADCQLSILR